MHGVGLRSSNCLYSVCRELRCAAMLAVAMLVWLYIRSSCHLSTVAVERSFCIVIFAVAVICKLAACMVLMLCWRYVAMWKCVSAGSLLLFREIAEVMFPSCDPSQGYCCNRLLVTCCSAEMMTFSLLIWRTHWRTVAVLKLCWQQVECRARDAGNACCADI